MANPDIAEHGIKTRFKPGVSGNIKGRPKGSQNIATIVKQLLDDEDLAGKVLARKPSYWQHLPNKNFAYAIVTVMMLKAMGGDVRAATWLRVTGFGNKVEPAYTERELKPVQIFNMRQYNRDSANKKPA
ncbi:MAG TPA: DUF5681 domain-containing protein [Candidatus Saccharimonadales bacterium]